MMATQPYRSGKVLEARGLDVVSDEIWVMLLTDEYSFNSFHSSRENLVSFESTGPGYKAGGRPVMGRKLEWAGDVLQVKAEDPLWSRASVRAKYAVLYRARGGEASKDELICCLDFGDNVSSMNGPFKIEWPGGVMRES